MQFGNKLGAFGNTVHAYCFKSISVFIRTVKKLFRPTTIFGELYISEPMDTDVFRK